MKLCQLKSLFSEAFSLVANASNARQVLREKNLKIVRNDFRCTKTWEQLIEVLGLINTLMNNIVPAVLNTVSKKNEWRNKTIRLLHSLNGDDENFTLDYYESLTNDELNEEYLSL